MAVKKKRRKWKPRHAHGPGDRHEHEENLAKRLAPLEETAAFRKSEQSDGNHGSVKDTIRVDRSSVKMPEKFLEDERDAADTFRLHPVVVAILAAMLTFIAFIAWQITLMPPPAK
ncbi:MAG: hypothetical protein M3416_08300 [Acidobacteriota bacterium]|nr:hypothetical protein [Acidobacteriota bacterium]